MRSAPAFAAEYGELGCNGACSVHEPDATLPYTSSVETCTTGPTPASRHACRSTCTPATLVATNGAAPLIERSTCVSAAKLITASCSGTSERTIAGSAISPCTKCRRGLADTGARL